MDEARIGAMKEEPRHGSYLLSGDRDSNGGGRWDRAKRLREHLSSSRLGFSVWCGLVFLVHLSCPVLSLSNEGNLSSVRHSLALHHPVSSERASVVRFVFFLA